jgi:Icc-related predicted phosphoesterase
VKLVALSDTHGLHDRLAVPPCDVLVHAGDFSPRGTREDAVNFLLWFDAQPAKRRILVAGNHDCFVEEHPAEWKRMLLSYPGITYLNDSGCEYGGLRFWGSPITPKFFDWSFMRERGHEIRKHWALIPQDTDVLITHGPPRGVGDRNDRGEFCGCADLTERVFDVEPRLHVFGHIHEGRGEYRLPNRRTRFLNVASIHRALYEPVEIALD